MRCCLSAGRTPEAGVLGKVMQALVSPPGVLAFWAAIGCSACTDMPTIAGHRDSPQTKLSSVQHWNVVARDVVDQLRVSMEEKRRRAKDNGADDVAKNDDEGEFERSGAAESIPSGSSPYEVEKETHVREQARGAGQGFEETQFEQRYEVEPAPADLPFKELGKNGPGRDGSADGERSKVCVLIWRPKQESKFQAFLGDAITTAVVERKDNFAYVAPDWRGCKSHKIGIIKIADVVVIKHTIANDRPYPGKYTLLAMGVVAVRHLVKHFSEASAVGAVAAGEVAYWASSGLRTSSTGAEIAITVSSLTDHRYVSRVTNTYYIEGYDSALYELPGATDAGGSRSIAAPVAQSQEQLFNGVAANDHLTHEECKLPKFDEVCKTASAQVPKAVVVGDLTIYPKAIPACQTVADIWVIGAHLAPAGSDYHLDQTRGKVLSGPEPYENVAPTGEELVHLLFENLQLSDRSSIPLSLTMKGPQGLATGTLPIEGTCKSETASENKKKAAKGPVVTIAPASGAPVDLCHLPAKLNLKASGSDVGKLSGASVQGLYGITYAGVINHQVGENYYTITFDNMPSLMRGATPLNLKLPVKLTLGKTTLSLNVPAVCN